MFARIAFINLAVVDLLLSISSACIRGPGFVDPVFIWGSNVAKSGGFSKWCEAGTLITWFISDLSLLGVIPLSFMFVFLYVPFLSLTKLSLLVCIISCWCVPVLEMMFILSSIAQKKIIVQYEDVFRRCTLRGEYSRYLDKENASVFFAIPLGIHIISWSLIIFYVCRVGNGYQDKQWWKFLKTGVIVVVTFTFTWLPYFIAVVWQTMEPDGWFTFVYCFLYSSVILNPLVYGMRSMQFNGKTIGDIVRDLFGEFRARAMSRPPAPNQVIGVENSTYSSYQDLDEDEGEDMNTIA